MKELSQARELDMTGIGFEHINFEQMPEFQRYMCLVKVLAECLGRNRP